MMDEFVQALGVRHGQVIQFLEKRDPLQGKENFVFERCWDFFKRRDLLGLELTAPPPKPRVMLELAQLQGIDLNRGKKRGREAGSDRRRKLQKTS
ncbi:hypothetical protein F4859DRAFT_495889 [Xylaria cf. heliscus]|nr:hypothetical protein F4859DRAFT_495889 [Xylaria cf. heliscus]